MKENVKKLQVLISVECYYDGISDSNNYPKVLHKLKKTLEVPQKLQE